MVIKLLLISLLVSVALMREKHPSNFILKTDYPAAELYAAENDYFDRFVFLGKKVKAIVEGPYVELQSIYTYKNFMDHLVVALFEFPQSEKDILQKVEIKHENQDNVRLIFEEMNSPEKDFNRENRFSEDKERFSYREIHAGNVRAHETVEVIFTVMRPLKIRLNQFYELSINPFEIPRFRTLNDGFMKGNYSIQVELRSEKPFAILANPTHQLRPKLSNHTDSLSGIITYKAFYNVSMIDVYWPTANFEIYFASSGFHAPQTIMATHPFNLHDHAFMFNIIPDMNYFPPYGWNPRSRKDVRSILKNLSNPDNFLKLKKAIRQSELHYFSNEYLFVIDRSDSMKGPHLENLKTTLNKLLDTLTGSASYFSILSFGNSSQLHWKRPEGNILYKTPEDTAEIMKWVETIEANMGEKDLLSALKYAFEEYEWTSLPKNVIILTDGQVSNVDEIIQLVQVNSHSQKIVL